MSIKTHFVITCMAYFYFGVGMSVEQWGIKVGLGLWPTIIIFSSSVCFLMFVTFASMQKVKDILFKKPTEKDK